MLLFLNASNWCSTCLPKNLSNVTKLEKESGLKNILTVIKSLLDKEALFVKEELRRTYKPKTEARVRLAADASGEENLRRIFDELERARNSWRC